MNKTKIILFDVDGVLIRLPNYFSKELENKGFKNAGEVLTSFYKGNDNHQCLDGKADAKKAIMPYLIKIGWKQTAEDYFKQQFQFERNYLDKKFIDLIKQLREKGVKCYLGTDQEKNRAELLLVELDFRNIFDGYFISCHVGYRKCHDNFWSYALKKLKKELPDIKPGEIVFFDDIQNNIDIAIKFGIQAFLFKSMAQFEKDLTALGLNKEKSL